MCRARRRRRIPVHQLRFQQKKALQNRNAFSMLT
jgi:hypothetical protein